MSGMNARLRGSGRREFDVRGDGDLGTGEIGAVCGGVVDIFGLCFRGEWTEQCRKRLFQRKMVMNGCCRREDKREFYRGCGD